MKLQSETDQEAAAVIAAVCLHALLATPKPLRHNNQPLDLIDSNRLAEMACDLSESMVAELKRRGWI